MGEWEPGDIRGGLGPGGLEGTLPGTEARVLALVGMTGRGQGGTCHLVPGA